MGIVKMEDVVAWNRDGAILCPDHGDKDGDDIPMTERDFANDDVVTCDFYDGVSVCGKRIC